jgi:hypothetical protein
MLMNGEQAKTVGKCFVRHQEGQAVGLSVDDKKNGRRDQTSLKSR